MCWTTGIALTVLGAYSFINEIQNYTDPTRVVLSLYLCAFGVLTISSELGLGYIRTYFQLIDGKKGRAVFFWFTGTLGLSFGPYTSPASKIVPFLLGIMAFVAGFFVALDRQCCCKEDSDAPVVNTAGAAKPGPNSI